jgi:hypothetical protein
MRLLSLLFSRVFRLLPALALLLVVTMSGTARAQEQAWSIDEYDALLSDLELADENRALTAPGSDEWRAATEEGISVRQQLISLISRSFRDGSLPDEFQAPAATERLIFIQNIVVLLSSMDECSAASSAMRLLDEAEESSSTELTAARDIAQQNIEECDQRMTLAAQPADPEVPPTTATTPIVEAPPEPEPARAERGPAPSPSPASTSGGGGRTAGIALIATGGAMIVGGLVLDAANAGGPRSEFTELSDQCPANCDTARLNELSDQISAAKLPIGILLFGGIGVGVTGAIVTAISPGRGDRVAVSPEWSPGYGGARVRVRW